MESESSPIVSLQRLDDYESLLERFYQELMVPTFPLADELDDLDDWRIAMRDDTMDVLLYCVNDNILGGLCYEWYHSKSIALLSYIVVRPEARGQGILRKLHTEFLKNVKDVTVLAEVNSLETPEEDPAEISQRHSLLHYLGYRHVPIHYVQPPLHTSQNSFDTILLLQRQQQDNDFFHNERILEYVVAFYHSVSEDPDWYKSHWFWNVAYSQCRQPLSCGDPMSTQKPPFQTIPRPDLPSKHVIVIGGGVSGLLAATKLCKVKDTHVTIVESKATFGGRIQSGILGSWQLPLGAEFVHGTSEVLQDYIDSTEPTFCLETMKGVYIADKGTVKPMPLEEYPDIDEVDHPHYTAVHVHTAAARSSTFSADEAIREGNNWDYGEHNARSPRLFQEVIDRLVEELQMAANVTLLTMSKVTSIQPFSLHEDWINVSIDGVNGSLIGDAVLCTIPLNKLKTMKFLGKYELPEAKQKAIQTIRMEAGIKAFVVLDRSKVDSIPDDAEIMFCPDEVATQIWFRRDEAGILVTFFIVSEQRDLFRQSGDAKETCLKQLKNVFGYDFSGACLAFDYFDWADGMYSSPSVHASKEMRDDLFEPIHNLYFAGEHTNAKTSASVQAAMESALHAVDRIQLDGILSLE